MDGSTFRPNEWILLSHLGNLLSTSMKSKHSGHNVFILIPSTSPSLCQIHGTVQTANDLKTAVDRPGKCVIFYRPCNEFKIYWLYIRADQEQGINFPTYARIIDDSTTLERFFPSMSSAVFHWFSQTWLMQDFQIFLPGCFELLRGLDIMSWLNVLIITDNLSDLSVTNQ